MNKTYWRAKQGNKQCPNQCNKRISLQTNTQPEHKMITEPNKLPISPSRLLRILQHRLRHAYRHKTRSSDYFSIIVASLRPGDIYLWAICISWTRLSDPVGRRGADITWHFHWMVAEDRRLQPGLLSKRSGDLLPFSSTDVAAVSFTLASLMLHFGSFWKIVYRAMWDRA